MKRLLIIFFQIICLVQLVGYGQINAFLDKETAFLSTEHTSSEPDYSVSSEERISLGTSPDSLDRKIIGVVSENIEEESEPGSVRKFLVSNLYFTAALQNSAPLYRHHTTKELLAYCDQMPFVSSTKKHIVFQVFRI